MEMKLVHTYFSLAPVYVTGLLEVSRRSYSSFTFYAVLKKTKIPEGVKGAMRVVYYSPLRLIAHDEA